MAKKKHHKKPHHKRRMSGTAGAQGFLGTLAAAGGVGAGIILGRMINNMVNPSTSTTPSVSPTILGLGEAAVAAYASKAFSRSFSNPIVKGVMMGFAGNGIMYAVSSKGLGLLPATIGYGPDPMHRPNRAQMTGFREVPKIGYPRPGVIGAPARMRHAAGVYG